MQLGQLLVVVCAWWWWCVLIFTSWTGGVQVQGVNTTIKIGALFAFNTAVGNEALTAVTLAVQDVNANNTVLKDVILELLLADSNCSSFQGAAAAVDMLEDNVVAIVGPQTSEIAHFAADLAGATQVPLVSFSATDPSLTKGQNHFFVRTVHSDAVQMTAIAAVIGLYGWREVVAVSTNDYVGMNSVDALSDALQPEGAVLGFKILMNHDVEKRDMIPLVTELSLLESRVFVVHLQPKIARMFFSTARSMAMMSTGCVWILSEATTSLLDDIPTTDSIWGSLQGVIGVRAYVPPTPELDSFHARFKAYMVSTRPSFIVSNKAVMNLYGLYAYDAVWMLAHAMNTFLNKGGNFSFVSRPPVPDNAGGKTDLANLKILAGGATFMDQLRNTRFEGLSGPISLSKFGDVEVNDYEIVNIFGTSQRVVGYWNNGTGFSQHPFNLNSPPPAPGWSQSSPGRSNEPPPPKLQDVIWPGGTAQVPKGWVVPKNGKPLLIGVPFKVGYKEFVDINPNRTMFHGFCIEVFQAALAFLPYSASFKFEVFGNGTSTPNYDELVEQVVKKRYDAVVGDITITTKRSKEVDFTQPYTASGLVVVVPTRAGGSSHAWAFMRPFTPLMWCTTGLFFLFTGLALWILEHKKNRDFRGRPKKQLVTTLWFIFSTLFFSQREKVKSTLGRAVLIIWLFVVLIVTSSYTASLTSILTVQQLLPTIQGIAGLVTSNVAIGYQAGSFVADYLQQLNVPKERLVPLETMTDYAEALSKGYVGAIVDELPYVQVFLSSECSFTIAGQEFTKSGWGFAFPKGSQLALDMSTAILSLAENGDLQKIHDYWLNSHDCTPLGPLVDANELGLNTFWGLFLITGAASILCVVVYYSRLIWQHYKSYRDEEFSESETLSSRTSRGRSFLRSLVSFIEEAEVAATVARADGSANNSQRKQKEKDRRKSRSTFGDERTENPDHQEQPDHASERHSHVVGGDRNVD
ncbi:hypothetical protein R1flu_020892 [Riccia fluitans]|uniref:Glutamate receptor n=1 Tax=Riccia fluitans TaxID=41844 RepID=A0ABD1ZR86_9MARC